MDKIIEMLYKHSYKDEVEGGETLHDSLFDDVAQEIHALRYQIARELFSEYHDALDGFLVGDSFMEWLDKKDVI